MARTTTPRPSTPTPSVVDQARALRRALEAVESVMSEEQLARSRQAGDAVRPGTTSDPALMPMVIVLPPATDDMETCPDCGRSRRRQ